MNIKQKPDVTACSKSTLHAVSLNKTYLNVLSQLVSQDVVIMCCMVEFYQIAVNTKKNTCDSVTNSISCLFLSFLGVIPSTDFLKASGVPLSSRGDVVVDKVGARLARIV